MPIGYSGVSSAVIEGSLTTWSASISLQEQSAHIITVVTDNITTVSGLSNTHTEVRPDNRLAGRAIKLNEYTNTNGAVADGVTTSWWYLPTVTGDGGLVQMTAFFSGNAGDAIMTAVGISVPEGKIVEIERAGIGDNIATASLLGLPLREYFLLGIFSAEGEDTAKTNDPDYIEIFDLVSSTAGAASGNIQTHGQYRIATLTGDTVVSSDVVFTNGFQCLIALFESDGPTTTLTSPANNALNQSLTPTLSFTPTQSTPIESGLNSALVISRGDITSPVSLRNSLAFGNVDAMEIVIEGSNLFAFGTTSWNWYQVTPTSFNSLGSGTTPQSSSNFFGITYLSGTVAGGNLRIAHANPRIGTTLATLGTYQFNGTSFVQVGSLLSFGSTSDSSNLTVARLTDTRVAVLRSLASGGYELRAYDFNGTNWSAVGSLINLGFSGPSSIASLDSSSIVIVNAWSWSIMSYSFNGTFWSQQSRRQTFSNTTAVSNVRAVDVQVMSPNRIALSNSYEGRLEIWRLIDSQYWALESRLTGISALDLNTSTAIGVINETDIVYYSNAIDTFRVYVASQITLIAEADNGGGFSTTAPLSSGVSYNYNVPAGSLQASTQYFWTLLTYGFTDFNWGTHAVGKYPVPRSFTTLSQGVDPLTVSSLLQNVTVLTSRNILVQPSTLTGTFSIQNPTIIAGVSVNVAATQLSVNSALQNSSVVISQNAIIAVGQLTNSIALQDPSILAIRNISVSATPLLVAASLQNATVQAIRNVAIAVTSSSVTSQIENAGVSVSEIISVSELQVSSVLQNVIVQVIRNVSIAATSLSGSFTIQNVTVQVVRNISIPANALSGNFVIQNATIQVVRNISVAATPLSASVAIQDVIVQAIRNVSIPANALSVTSQIQDVVVQTIRNISVAATPLSTSITLQNVSVIAGVSVIILPNSLGASFTVQQPIVSVIRNIQVVAQAFETTIAIPNVSIVTQRNVAISVTGFQANFLLNQPSVSAVGNAIIAVNSLSVNSAINNVAIIGNAIEQVTQLSVSVILQNAGVISNGNDIVPVSASNLILELKQPQVIAVKNSITAVQALGLLVGLQNAVVKIDAVATPNSNNVTSVLNNPSIQSGTGAIIQATGLTVSIQLNSVSIIVGQAILIDANVLQVNGMINNSGISVTAFVTPEELLIGSTLQIASAGIIAGPEIVYIVSPLVRSVDLMSQLTRNLDLTSSINRIVEINSNID